MELQKAFCVHILGDELLALCYLSKTPKNLFRSKGYCEALHQSKTKRQAQLKSCENAVTTPRQPLLPIVTRF